MHEKRAYNFKDISGKKFGRLLAIDLSHTIKTSSGSKTVWNCVCECGSKKKVGGWQLRGGHNTSCGSGGKCHQNYTHGKSYTPEYRTRKSRLWKLAKKYGISEDTYNFMFESQNGLCKICNLENGILTVDHDHRTGKVRGLLCNTCNSGIGLLKDSSEVLKNAVKYLEEFEV